jgi:hypothetical protein
LQETIKQDITDAELASLEVGEKLFWSWLPANDQSGGMLLGVRDSLFEVGRMDMGQFFLSFSVLHRMSNKKLEVLLVFMDPQTTPVPGGSWTRFLTRLLGALYRSSWEAISILSERPKIRVMITLTGL